MTNTVTHYEADYHGTRHKSHFNEDYYTARAKVALSKFFSNIPKDAKILDYGCGLGQNIYLLPNAKGYDISTFGLDFCRAKGLDVTDDIEKIENDSFDYVFSSHVLEHHPHPKQMIEEMRSKLKKNHDLILVIPFEKHGKSSFDLDLNQHLHMWNFRTINNLLITNGFKIKSNQYLRGAGYEKLLPLFRINFNAYRFATNAVSRLFGIKEIMVVATKV
ncbi:class I SAM-dependent methyltransferase [Tunicatimonas pelagia]|uniref:class I SAM-dependent methyltransferase n=1 Tax=Tunicatimonas pelagia TaxID=931531 RepID=UPI0026666474|nr:class I SAM-dependent methyltransferase [Tunicatimonas pelagia]WKN42316.1 class I SAM-dependent methyltransferase [Tunicatimonas pelagia]